jgi:VWFA-related protein
MLTVLRPALPARRFVVLGLLGLLLVAHQPRPRAQQAEGAQQAPPVFRGGVNFVSVDVFPRRDGTFIEGLRAEDFEVFEDGVRQAVESFEFVRIEPNSVDSERRDPTSQADGDRQAADPKNRVFVVYLDVIHTTVNGSHQTQRPVVDFLTRTIGARDLFGVMTHKTPAAQLVFGRRLETIEGELTRYWTWGRAQRLTLQPETESAYEERLMDCVDAVHKDRVASLPWPGEATDKMMALMHLIITLHREDLLMSNLETLMERLGTLRDERKNVLFISEGWVPGGPREDLRNLTVGEKAGGDYPSVWGKPGGSFGTVATNPYAGVDDAWCDSEFRRVAQIDFEHRFRDLLAAANQANVSFYPIDVGGLRTSAASTRATDTLRTMAENTDGFAIVGTNDLAGGVRRIENDLSAFYLLGYNSTNSASNGRFRRIEVTTKVPGARISARRGYFAMTPAMAAAAAAPRANAGPSAVDDALGRLTSVRADADLFVAGAARPAGLDVAVEIPAATVTREGWSQGSSLQVLVTAADGRNHNATATLAAGERSALLTLTAAEVGTGPWRVVVQAAGRDRRIEQRLDIAAASGRLIGLPMAWRGTPSPRVPLKPLADARLNRLERLRVEWPVLAPADVHAARLLDRTGKPLGQALPFATLPADRQALAVDLPIGALPEGEYVVELVATRGAESERRLLAFRVVR